MKLRNFVLLILLTLLFSLQLGSPNSVLAVTYTAQYGGFLLPFDYRNGTAELSANLIYPKGGSHEGAIDIRQGQNNGRFNILAPKDGVVIFAEDEMTNDWFGACTEIAPAANYLVLGHGPKKADGTYPFYTVYFHLTTNSIQHNVGDRVHVGEVIASAGRTGRGETSRVGDDAGVHLHFFGTSVPPKQKTATAQKCGTSTKVERQWISYSSGEAVGFEEYGNQWPIFGNEKAIGALKPSYNNTNFETNECNPEEDTLILYEHVDYGGECFVVEDPSQNNNVPNDLGPDGMQVSSMYLDPSYFNVSNHLLHLYDDYGSSGNTTEILGSASTLGDWNDRTRKQAVFASTQ